MFISCPPLLSDPLGSGETDERVLVPEPVCEADCTAHQEDPGENPQLPGEGQGVVRGASEAAARRRDQLREEQEQRSLTVAKDR